MGKVWQPSVQHEERKLRARIFKLFMFCTLIKLLGVCKGFSRDAQLQAACSVNTSCCHKAFVLLHDAMEIIIGQPWQNSS
jgi:hypothetical protein